MAMLNIQRVYVAVSENLAETKKTHSVHRSRTSRSFSDMTISRHFPVEKPWQLPFVHRSRQRGSVFSIP
jgi:hypothetical protein